jgi:hypothetical protein
MHGGGTENLALEAPASFRISMSFAHALLARLRSHPVVALSGALAAIAGVVGLSIPTEGFWPTAAVVLGVLLGLMTLAAVSFWHEDQAARELQLSVEVGGVKVLEPKASKSAAILVVVHSSRITNRSRENRVSLGIRFVADRYTGELHLSLAARDMPESALKTPLEIGPQETRAGLLLFTLPDLFADMFGADVERALARRGPKSANARLEIEDYVSGRSITLPVPGSHP